VPAKQPEYYREILTYRTDYYWRYRYIKQAIAEIYRNIKQPIAGKYRYINQGIARKYLQIKQAIA
jgi:hypothetical protein